MLSVGHAALHLPQRMHSAELGLLSTSTSIGHTFSQRLPRKENMTNDGPASPLLGRADHYRAGGFPVGWWPSRPEPLETELSLFLVVYYPSGSSERQECRNHGFGSVAVHDCNPQRSMNCGATGLQIGRGSDSTAELSSTI